MSRSASLTPWKASDGVVRKTRSLSSSVVSAGAEADGEIMTTPPGMPAAVAAPIVAPVQKAPTMPVTLSVLTSLSAAGPATDGSQALSPVTTLILPPSRMPPWALTSSKASLAPATMGGARLSIGPVMSPRIPTVTSAASAGEAASKAATAARPTNLFIVIMDVPLQRLPGFAAVFDLVLPVQRLVGGPEKPSAGADIAQIVRA